MLRKAITLMLALVLFICGCKARDTSQDVTFEQENHDYTLVILTDVDTFKTNPKAAAFVMYALDHYFRDRVGTNDQVIISQLSGNDRPLIFHGTATELRNEYGSEEAIRNLIISRSAPGRRINDGVCKSLKYVLKSYGVKKDGVVPVTLVVSSMIDEASVATEDQVIESLIEYGRVGHMAYYFVDQNRMEAIEERMEKAGHKFTYLESDVRGRPALPQFHR